MQLKSIRSRKLRATNLLSTLLNKINKLKTKTIRAENFNKSNTLSNHMFARLHCMKTQHSAFLRTKFPDRQSAERMYSFIMIHELPLEGCFCIVMFFCTLLDDVSFNWYIITMKKNLPEGSMTFLFITRMQIVDCWCRDYIQNSAIFVEVVADIPSSHENPLNRIEIYLLSWVNYCILYIITASTLLTSDC